MNWRQDLGFCQDTVFILDISCRFIERYFGRTDADNLVVTYFERYGQFADERYVRHELSWGMAVQIYYTVALGGDRSDVRSWQRENGWLETPPEALAYLREHYWSKVQV